MAEKLTPAQVAYRKWYKANKIAFNKARAEKYAANPELQEKTRVKQKIYRESIPREKASGEHYRTIKGKVTQVFRIGAVAQMIGRDEQSIRSWEAKGYIPKPTIKSTHRYYTPNQIKLMSEWAELSGLLRWDPKVREEALPKKSAEIKALWAGA